MTEQPDGYQAMLREHQDKVYALAEKLRAEWFHVCCRMSAAGRSQLEKEEEFRYWVIGQIAKLHLERPT